MLHVQLLSVSLKLSKNWEEKKLQFLLNPEVPLCGQNLFYLDKDYQITLHTN